MGADYKHTRHEEYKFTAEATLGPNLARRFAAGALAANDNARFLVDRPLQTVSIRVWLGVAPGAGENTVFTLRVNTVPTALTVNVQNLATTGFLAAQIALVPGDTLNMHVESSLNAAVSPVAATLKTVG